MNSAGPWWGTPVITFTGVLLTLLSTMLINFWSRRRETAFRWAEAKKQLYSSFVQASHDLRRTPVWPADADPATTLDVLRQLTVEFEIIAPHQVTQRAAAVLTAAERLTKSTLQIRSESKAAHGHSVADRFRQSHAEAESNFADSMQQFLRAARTDLDVPSGFVPLETGRAE